MIISHTRCIVTTTTDEVVESVETASDFPVRSFTPDYGFSYEPDYSSDLDDEDDVVPLAEWERELLDVPNVEAAPQQALTVAIQRNGVPSGTFTYPSIAAFSRAVESYGSSYSNTDELTLTIRKS